MESPHNIGLVHRKCAEDRAKKWNDENKDLLINAGDFVKIAFWEKGEVEHMWAEVVSNTRQESFKATVANDPVVCMSYPLGKEIELSRFEIQQYLPKIA